MVVVTVNYRLGPWGELSLDSGRVSGNQGLRDQVCHYLHPITFFLSLSSAITKITVHTAIPVRCVQKTNSRSGARSTMGPGQHCTSWRKSRRGRHLGRERWSLVAILIITNHPSVKGWWPTWSSYQEYYNHDYETLKGLTLGTKIIIAIILK